MMFIKTAEGNLMNTRHIVKIYIDEPMFEQKTFNVSAKLIYGTEILSRHNTRSEAEKALEKYLHMD